MLPMLIDRSASRRLRVDSAIITELKFDRTFPVLQSDKLVLQKEPARKIASDVQPLFNDY